MIEAEIGAEIEAEIGAEIGAGTGAEIEMTAEKVMNKIGKGIDRLL